MTNEEFIQSITLPGEEWRDVVGYEGYYIVSSYGRIATIRDYCEQLSHGKLVRYPLKRHVCSTPCPLGTMYKRITFVVNGKKKSFLLHRIVACAFLPNPNKYPVVDHIDDNPDNNRADNLQWCEQRTNNLKPHHREASSASHKGQISAQRKKVLQMKDGQIIREYDSVAETVKYGFNAVCVAQVCRGVCRTHRGYNWAYLSDYKPQVSMSKNSDS